MKEAILPAPPGVNSLYANVPGKGRVKTNGYRVWVKGAGLVLNAARLGRHDGPVGVYIRVGRPPKRRDLDGYFKALIDLLVTCQVIPDDNADYIKTIFAAWSYEIPDGCVGIAVEPDLSRVEAS